CGAGPGAHVTDRLAALLTDPTRAAEVPVAEVPVLLDAVSAQAARLDVVKSILAARLAAGPYGPSPAAARTPRYVTQAEAAELFGLPAGDGRYLPGRGI